MRDLEPREADGSGVTAVKRSIITACELFTSGQQNPADAESLNSDAVVSRLSEELSPSVLYHGELLRQPMIY
jgi:hypothetical protein